MRILRAHRKIINSLMIALMAFWQIGQPLQAATFIWDGGSNTWDNGTTLFWNGGAAWANGVGSTAQFGGTAGTVTIGAGITAGSLIFNTAGYTIAGGGNSLTLGSPAYSATGFAGEPRGIALSAAASSLLTTISANTILANSQNWNAGVFNYLLNSGVVSEAATGYGLRALEGRCGHGCSYKRKYLHRHGDGPQRHPRARERDSGRHWLLGAPEWW